MPISEDEYEILSTQEPATMSKAELRKVGVDKILNVPTNPFFPDPQTHHGEETKGAYQPLPKRNQVIDPRGHEQRRKHLGNTFATIICKLITTAACKTLEIGESRHLGNGGQALAERATPTIGVGDGHRPFSSTQVQVWF
jgi:hypothetical protein